MITSVASLGTFAAGDILQVRFRAAYDTNTSGGSPDWEITDVQVDRIPEPSAMALSLLGLVLAGVGRRRRIGKI